MNSRPQAYLGQIIHSAFPKCNHVFPILAVVTVGLVGCGGGGPPRAAVQGSVTWQGKPVENGTINFISTGTGGSASATIVGGKYQLSTAEGAPLGTNRVEVFGFNNLGSREAGPPHPPGTMIEATEQFIPSEYNNASKQTVEIQAGENNIDLALPIK